MDTPNPTPPPSGPNFEKDVSGLPPVDPVASLPPAMSSEERNWGMACHLSSLAGYLLPTANIFAPLIIWMMNREKMPFVDSEGKESVNFQISITIYVLATIILMFASCGILFFLPIIVGVFALVMIIIASIQSAKGVPYRYPLCIRLVK